MSTSGTQNELGFVALASVVVISLVLFVITFSLAFSGFYLRVNVLDLEYKQVSFSLARSCVEHALLDIAIGTYTAPRTLRLKQGSCQICHIDAVSVPHSIKTRAVYNKAVTNLTATASPIPAVNPSNVVIDHLTEEEIYSGPQCP